MKRGSGISPRSSGSSRRIHQAAVARRQRPLHPPEGLVGFAAPGVDGGDLERPVVGVAGDELVERRLGLGASPPGVERRRGQLQPEQLLVAPLGHLERRLGPSLHQLDQREVGGGEVLAGLQLQRTVGGPPRPAQLPLGEEDGGQRGPGAAGERVEPRRLERRGAGVGQQADGGQDVAGVALPISALPGSSATARSKSERAPIQSQSRLARRKPRAANPSASSGVSVTACSAAVMASSRACFSSAALPSMLA